MKTETVRKIRVKASNEYDVLIGQNLIEKAGELVSEVIDKCKVLIVTDSTVDTLYSLKVEISLKNAGFSVYKFVFEAGEKSKNLATYSKILSALADNQFTRTDAIIALGGGVTGDMAGFASATFLRGISYIQIPTTLLAQVDSSVGGKTAVDLPQGKNLVGAFKQPKLVICDTNVLNSLPQNVFNDGMGEIAKYAVLDKKVFDLIDKGDYDIAQLVYLCIDYKRMIVEADEFESSKRRLLNLGHTIAHGIESLSDYNIEHGKAVAMGVKIILSASLKNGQISKSEFDKINNVIDKCVKLQTQPFALKDICERALCDKKRAGDNITLVTIYGVGDCREYKIKVQDMLEYLS